jgi:uncharacterized protein (DUF2336 family)
MASAPQALLDDLEHVVSDKNIGDRAAILRRVADLFVVASGRVSDEQVALFDDVMLRLLEEIESSARAAFSHILATVPDAPPRAVRMLALDNVIDVAGPILAHSERVDELTLVEGAKTKSQAHMLAISRRKTLPESVTDILVIRGDHQVVLSAAGNHGAAFSEFGYSTLVQRSSSDGDLAACIWLCPEVPRQHLLKLFAEASESVKLDMTSKDPRKASVIQEIVAQASHQIQTQTREKSAGYAAALAHVQSLHAMGGLGEPQLAEFARTGKFDETAVALSFICELPIALVERAFVDERSEQIIVIAKAFGVPWETVKAILLLQDKVKNDAKRKLDKHFETFTRLQVETAKKAIQFYRLRERATAPGLH